MIAIQSAFFMICLTFTWTLKSASSKLVDKACLVGGVYVGRRTFRNVFQYTLLVSIRGESVAYTAQARHSSAFLWLCSSIEVKKKLLIPGGPWAVAIDKVSDLSFSPRREAEGLLSEVACCEHWGNFMHFRLFCIFVAFFSYGLTHYLQIAFTTTLETVKCLHTSDSAHGIFL